MLTIGLTGLIGSGKSTVAGLFARFGASLIDTDIIAHELTTTGGMAIPLITKEFGAGFVDGNGSLIRDKMRELVFNDSSARQLLESILHPLIFVQVERQLSKNKLADDYTIIVVPLLFKSKKYLQLTNRNIFVDCNHDEIIRRLKIRNGFSVEQVRAILATHILPDTQIMMADDIIYNNNDLDSLKTQVATLHQKYLALRYTCQ